MRSCHLTLAIPLLIASVLVPARSDGQTIGACPELAVPHLVIKAGYDTLACDLVRRSPTLARQIHTLATSKDVHVVVRPPMSALHGCRARARIRRSDTGVSAVIEIPISSDFAELLSHELEHVLEQLEGLDLEHLSGIAPTQAYRTSSGAFETERARRAGRAVRREVLMPWPERAATGTRSDGW